MDNVIKKMKENSEIFGIKKQENGNVEEFFKQELMCENVPEEVLKFYQEFDGCSFSINDVFSLAEIKNFLAGHFNDFLEFMELSNKEKFIPIMNDGMGGYYAFMSTKKEEIICYLDHEFPDRILEYDNFSSLLEDQINYTLENNEDIYDNDF